MTLTPEQLAQRALGVSASEVAAVCSLSPWEGPWSVWAKKKGHMIVEMSDEMYLGHLMEPVVSAMYARRHPDVTLRESLTLSHPDNPWAMATPDRFVTSPEGEWLLECKSGGAHASREWGEGDDEVPPHYLLQCMWQLYVTGLSRCDMAGYIGGELHFKTIRRHDGMIEALVSKCRAFYERHIVGDEEPAIDGMESTTNALAAMFPEAREPLREATAEESALIAEYLAAGERVAVEETEKDRLANAIRAAIGDAEGFASGGLKATWKAPQGGRTNWKGVAEAMKADAATIAANTTPNTRRLDVRQKKDKR